MSYSSTNEKKPTKLRSTDANRFPLQSNLYRQSLHHADSNRIEPAPPIGRCDACPRWRARLVEHRHPSHQPVGPPRATPCHCQERRPHANLVHLVHLRAVEVAQADPIERKIADQLRVGNAQPLRSPATPGLRNTSTRSRLPAPNVIFTTMKFVCVFSLAQRREVLQTVDVHVRRHAVAHSLRPRCRCTARGSRCRRCGAARRRRTRRPSFDALQEAEVDRRAVAADEPRAVLVFDQPGRVEHAADRRAERAADAVLLASLNGAVARSATCLRIRDRPSSTRFVAPVRHRPTSTLNHGPAQPKPPFCSESGPSG